MKISFLAREVWEGIRGNLSMVLSIVLVTFVSLSFVSAAALLQIQIGSLKSYWYEKAQIAIYFCNDFESELICPGGAATKVQQIAVARQLQSPAISPYIDSYSFESQEDAFHRLLEEMGELNARQYLNPDQLNATYWVTLSDPEKTELVVEILESQSGVAAVADQRSYFDPILRLMQGATLAVGSLAAVMLGSAALLTTTTIRLSAFARRREIGIMRLVGASGASIQLPFLLEGVLASLLGGVLAIGLSVFLVDTYLIDSLASDLAFSHFVTVNDVWALAPLVLGLGATIAVLASSVSIFRHLRT